MKLTLLSSSSLHRRQGFALVASISVMVLLMLVALGLITLSTAESRNTSRERSLAIAQSNARMALNIALSTLQEEMGPDRRVTTEAAIFDTDKNTSQIEGVNQPHWLASYNAWGSWLNANYTIPGESSPLKIQDTYVDKRKPMFRRWLLSMPKGDELNPELAMSGATLNQQNSVVLVGEGTLGNLTGSDTNKITRAYLQDAPDGGKLAWWIGGENQKGKASLAAKDMTLTTDQYEVAGGNAPVSGVDSIDGIQTLKGKSADMEKLLTQGALTNAGIDREVAGSHFFDLTVHSMGLPASVRTGSLKRDLSLMFESEMLPEGYSYKAGMAMEPSIRPVSPDILNHEPQIVGRGFASWEDMKRYFRVYRSEATDGKPPLVWNGTSAETIREGDDSTDEYAATSPGRYDRVPLLGKFTVIYSTQTRKVAEDKYDCYLVYSPVITLWNPYNTELRVPKKGISMLTQAYKIQPIAYASYKGQIAQTGWKKINQGHADAGSAQSRDFGMVIGDPDKELVFKPGEFKIFSYKKTGSINVVQSPTYGWVIDAAFEGFDPQGIAGISYKIFSGITRPENPGIRLRFDYPYGSDGNVWFGNTPGSLNLMLGLNGTSPYVYQHDWLSKAEGNTQITLSDSSGIARWEFDDQPAPFAFMTVAMKSSSAMDYESIGWSEDWRCRNWVQAPPQYFGDALYASDDPQMLHTQRMNSPYYVHFGPMSPAELPKVVPHEGNNSWLGSGTEPREQITALSMLDLPTAPLSSLASFSTMRINPGWHQNSAYPFEGGTWNSANALGKRKRYQSGITGPGVGNSFAHPIIPGDSIYRFMDNSSAQDISSPNGPFVKHDSRAFCDFWDHTFLINDALWDDYYLSSISTQTRPGATQAKTASVLLDDFYIKGQELPNTRMVSYLGSEKAEDVVAGLQAENGYLKAASHMTVDGAFNVNSTSVEAWKALFHSVRENLPTYRNSTKHELIKPKDDDSIVVSRMNTATSDKEYDNIELGVQREDGLRTWTGVRYISDEQIQKLAEECVKQVKARGPFLTFSEFINRRLSEDDLGVKGALQAAIDYDEENPSPESINYKFKNDPSYRLTGGDLGTAVKPYYANEKAAFGSRFAGVPGYVIQSDILKPLANTLTVRDDTFRIRAYGEHRDEKGNIMARVWCEAIVQRVPEYIDPSDEPWESYGHIAEDGTITDAGELSELNKKFGRRFKVIQFRWLNDDEV